MIRRELVKKTNKKNLMQTETNREPTGAHH